MRTELLFTSPGSVSFSKEMRNRNQKYGESIKETLDKESYDLLLNSKIFDRPTEATTRPTFTAIGLPSDIVEISYSVQHWNVFENTIWKMFIQMDLESLNAGRIAVQVSEKDYFMANGIFCTKNHMFVCRALYSPKSGNIDTQKNSLHEDASAWMENFSKATNYLQEQYLECNGKKVIPLLVTRGYLISSEDRTELKNLGIYTINDRFVDELTRIASKNGAFARTVLCQELFRGETLPYDVPPFNALMEKIDGAKVYNFFATAEQIVDTMYVHRRIPQDIGFAMAYQRMVKPDKVLNIIAYLRKSGAFFPNSIVVAIEKESFRKSDGNFGKLQLPNVYGNMWIIDGQHRLYGSAFSDTKKPISICAIQGLDGILQAKQFSSINSNQTPVSQDLIWDLKGELYQGINEPTTKDEVEMRREYFVSNTWKYVNQTEGPLSGRIKIPSQTPAEKIGYGALCKNLNKSVIWKDGILINTPMQDDVIVQVGELLISMFKGIQKELINEWDKPNAGPKQKKNWIHLSYSMEIICKLFSEGVQYFSTNEKYLNNWHDEELSKQYMEKLGTSIGTAIMCDDYGFFAGDKDIRKAGNAAVRKEYFSDLVISMREHNPEWFTPKFAPGIGYEDFSSLKFSPQIKKKVESIEKKLRVLCADVLELEGTGGITKYLNGKYLDSINRSLEQEKNWTDISLFNDRKKLEYLSLAELQEVIIKKKHYSKLEIQVNKIIFDEQFRYVKLIRNGIAHARDFPDYKTKKLWTASLEQVWDWLKEAKIKELID